MYSLPTYCQKMNQETNSYSQDCQHSKHNEGNHPYWQRWTGSCDRSASKGSKYKRYIRNSEINRRHSKSLFLSSCSLPEAQFRHHSSKKYMKKIKKMKKGRKEEHKRKKGRKEKKEKSLKSNLSGFML